jgi:hypothetical protein
MSYTSFCFNVIEFFSGFQDLESMSVTYHFHLTDAEYSVMELAAETLIFEKDQALLQHPLSPQL